ncbi:hypothetical protein RKE25_23230 (plasmid) [Dyella sp. BiH032]|uniref:hypothetical protein n=1 Tax=Dyella sp. BiH032 TaxID=3075430 RepID=UPI002892A5BE|nr:hypothetical protein [Dyella sp. BiH032]WNL48529.1 hypothetical protein RKE25_23230 [Dyella sp. BiH032]
MKAVARLRSLSDKLSFWKRVQVRVSSRQGRALAIACLFAGLGSLALPFVVLGVTHSVPAGWKGSFVILFPFLLAWFLIGLGGCFLGEINRARIEEIDARIAELDAELAELNRKKREHSHA